MEDSNMDKKYEREQIKTGRLKGQYYVVPEDMGEKYYTLSDLTKNTKRWIVEKYFPPHDAIISPRYGTQEQQNKIDLRKLWYRETIDQNQWIQDNYAFVYGGQDYEKTSSGKDCLIFYSEPGVKQAMAVKSKNGWIPKVKMGTNWRNAKGCKAQPTADEAIKLAKEYDVPSYNEYIESKELA